MGATVIVGVGNALRRDDGAGLAAARRLRDFVSGDVQIIVKEGDVTSLLDDWQGASTVILIDATFSEARPGTIRRHEASARPLPSAFSRSSTHSFGVAEVVELARALGRLPPRVIVFGIEGQDFTQGEARSPDVDRAIDEVVRLVKIHVVSVARPAAGSRAPSGRV